MYSFWRYLLPIVLIWTGCSTSRKEITYTPAPTTPEYTLPEPNDFLPAPIVTNSTPLNVKTNTPIQPGPVIRSTIPSATNNTLRLSPTFPIHSTESQLAWIDLKHWSADFRKAELKQTGSGPYPSYRLQSSAGTLEFTIKNQMARWNGLSFMLGYAPLADHGKPFIQNLDLEKTVLPLMENSHNQLKNKTIVIDPGHGGEQFGTPSFGGNHFEKEYTLDWALRLQSLLSNAGWKVLLTRTNDADIALTNRVAVADNARAALFISLHFNSLANREQSGLETYCLTPAGMPSNLVRGSEERIPQANNAFDNENLYWAMQLHHQLVRNTHSIDRGIRRARFLAVLRTQKRPAVLIEGGYLSNRRESELIATPAYRQKLAEAVAKAILKQ